MNKFSYSYHDEVSMWASWSPCIFAIIVSAFGYNTSLLLLNIAHIRRYHVNSGPSAISAVWDERVLPARQMALDTRNSIMPGPFSYTDWFHRPSDGLGGFLYPFSRNRLQPFVPVSSYFDPRFIDARSKTKNFEERLTKRLRKNNSKLQKKIRKAVRKHGKNRDKILTKSERRLHGKGGME